MDAWTRLLIPWILVSLVTTVSCEDRVQAFVAQDVLLPCTYSRADKLPREVNAFWRAVDDNANVYDIVRNLADLSGQDPRFRGRVSGFSKEFVNGNFSVVLRSVRLTDSGVYDCFVAEVNFQNQVDLRVSGEPMEPRRTPAPPTVPAVRGGSAAVRATGLSLLLGLLLC